MVHAGQVIELGTVTLRFLTTRAESGGAVHEMRATYDPGSPSPPAHLHPAQTETFVVESGALRFVVDGVERVVAAGSSIVIEAGQVHQVRNEHDGRPAVALWRTEPALRTGELFEEMAAAGQDLHRMLSVLGDHAEEITLA